MIPMTIRSSMSVKAGAVRAWRGLARRARGCGVVLGVSPDRRCGTSAPWLPGPRPDAHHRAVGRRLAPQTRPTHKVFALSAGSRYFATVVDVGQDHVVSLP